MGLRCRNPHRHLSQLKARPIPLIETPSGQELCRPSIFFHGLFIGTPPNPNIKVVFRDSSRHISGEQMGVGYCACVTGSAVTGSGHDRKWRHMKSRDRKWRHNRKYVLHMPWSAFPLLFFTIVVVRNIPLFMTGSSMANGVTWPEVTWLGVTAKEVTSFFHVFFLL